MASLLLLALAMSAPQPPGFTVVVPRKLMPPLAPYLKARAADFDTKLAILEDVVSSHQGVDDAEKLKRFLYDEWKHRNVRFVLLVGDADVMPDRYMCLDRATTAAYDYAFYPCDLYYADVARADGTFDDWNGNKEGFHAGYFGEVRGEKNKNDPINFDGVSYLPELALGRWPVSTPAEVATVVHKTLAREKALQDNPLAFRSGVFCCVPGWVDARGRMDGWANSLSGWRCERQFADTPTPPTTANLVKSLNAGVGLVFHVGHGEAWGWDRNLHVRDLKGVKNERVLPVMLSAGCSTAYHATLAPYQGYVDVNGVEHQGTDAGEVFKSPPPPPRCYQSGKYNPASLGEQIVRGGPNGAVAYIGCNTGGQPCGITLLEGFAKSVTNSPNRRLGEAWRDAIHYYYQAEHLADLKPDKGWYPPSIYFQGMKYMLFGDPTTPLGN